ncbi:sigma-70 family RNA polymerase sigma factor [Photorhabdus cinerea]|uniref:RNA polymerase sigma factor n=1 Tax=Photorhabdus cinerea TaxID=471575 RepID=A0A7X5QE14_9GAMM|nr:sigma-70 family RNA polymerase sigma factor [Photorhabdus cinerea]NHB92512.1 RNA polymerase subunit sigma [Photorhabdus cinerea]
MATPKAISEINSFAQQFYFEHHEWLYNWLCHKVSCPCHAEDLTQDTFLNVLSGSNLSNIRQPRPFLATVARCLIANYYRRRKIEENYLEYVNSIPETTIPSTESKFAAFEQLEKLEITLDKLPNRVKEAFLLAQLQGLRYSEIADQLQISSSSVKQYLQRAHNKCKKIQILT